MSSTPQRLVEAAHRAGWQHQCLRADGGRVRRDFFSRGAALISVFYSPRMAITEAYRSTLGEETSWLRSNDAGKAGKIMGWLKGAV